MLNTLAGDRIPMTAEMKALFEPENLMNASPATVSRMGIIYFSISVLGWQPLAASWLQTRREKEQPILRELIDKYSSLPSLPLPRSCRRATCR